MSVPNDTVSSYGRGQLLCLLDASKHEIFAYDRGQFCEKVEGVDSLEVPVQKSN